MEIERQLAARAQAAPGKTQRIQGHLDFRRNLGALTFLVVRDRSGTIQVVVSNPDLVREAREIELQSAIAVTGQVVERQGQSAGVELQAESITVLGAAITTLPVQVNQKERMDGLSLAAMLNYRPLTLRNEKVKAIFKIESEITGAFAEFLKQEGFTEIRSSKIVATGTEGGAQLFGLDYFGRKAYLAQSPQFYKQMMVGVFERVFEMGPVYRAEEHDTTRHLNEYISLDLEMGFIKNEQDLLALETRLLKHVFAHVAKTCQAELALHNAVVPEVTSIGQITLAEARKLLASQYGHEAQGEDLDSEGERLLCQHFAEQGEGEFVFVTHYPRKIRPFYAMPVAGDGMELTASFDLLFRGQEVTTGGQRIHEHAMLCESIKSRGMDPESFNDYLMCFRHGMPPHGGLAIGLERLTTRLLGLPNIKLASLFPRDQQRLSP